jgi:molybdenum cofactor cytidylyltransferase
MSNCGIVILAAGSSTRLGQPKQLLRFQGTTLIRRAALTALATSCRPVVVVLGAAHVESAQEVSSLPVKTIVNSQWELGMGTSIRAGVTEAAAAAVDSVVLLLCDQPLITTEAIDELVRRRTACGKRICAASYAGTLGTPAVFSADLFGELTNLPDGAGGKSLMARHAADVEAMDLPEAETDVDTEADAEKLMISFPDSIQ